MKKIVSLIFAVLLTASLDIFAKAKMITVTSLNGKDEVTSIEVPFNPSRIAILDFAALDIIDTLGLGSKVTGCAVTNIEYLSKYSPDKNKKIKNIGNIKQPDMEALFECEPDVIFISGRLAARYDELSRIAPVIYLSTDMNLGLVESVKNNAKTIASIFGKEEEVAASFTQLDARILNLNSKAEGKTAVLSLVTSGSCNLLGNNGRLNLITNEIGFTNIGANLAKGRDPAARQPKNANAEKAGSPAASAVQAHGEESSFELIAKVNPEYIFVLDRDSAIGTKGAKLAKDVMDNEIVNMTKAAKEGNLVILPSPEIWYTAEGGIQSLDYMLRDLEAVL